MSMGASGALQAAVYAQLTGDAALAAVVGTDIYDQPPSGALPPIYVLLGEEVVRDASDGTARGATHDLAITVTTSAAGFADAKAAAAAITDALDGAALTLTRGVLLGLWFVRAKAVRDGTAGVRRIEMTFRARIEDN